MLQSIIVTILVQYCYNLTHKNKFKIFNSLFNCVYFSVKFLRYYNLKHDPHRQAVRHAFFRAVIFFLRLLLITNTPQTLIIPLFEIF